MWLVALLACGGPPQLTIASGACAQADPCKVPLLSAAPVNTAGEPLVWDLLFLDQAEPDLLCVMGGCRTTLPAGSHDLWNGTDSPPLSVVVKS